MSIAAVELWNKFIDLIMGYALIGPADYAGGVAWAHVTANVMDWFMVIGLSVMNIIIILEVIKASMNLKQNITVELLAESGIKLILANGIMIILPDILRGLFDIAQALAVLVGGTNYADLHISSATMEALQNETAESLFVKLGKLLNDLVFSEILGLFFMLVVIVCLGMIFVTVFSRLLNLFMLVAMSPIAVSTIPGTGQVGQTATAFFKTLLCKTFEIVVIVLAMYLGALIANTFTENIVVGEITEAVLLQMGSVVMITSAVKGADTLMRRAFNL